jgi:sugar phosphate isomerase/epimerase
MKLSLDTIGYGGYFTAPGEQLALEDAVRRAAQFGYDAACIYAHRPLGFPLDLGADRRKHLKDLYRQLDLEMGAIVCCTSFLEANHVLLYPQEKEILYVRECIRLAKDLGANIVRILAGFYGYFQNPFAGQGYGLPSFESRSRRVSRGEDWLEAWHQVQRGIREVALYAQDEGITLALQTHPEITMNNDDTLELLAEIDVPSLKVGLDLPLLESADPEFVRRTVLRMKDLMVYSHTISLRKIFTVGGAPAGWEEVTPGEALDPLPWEAFLKACQEIGYTGLLSAEQCSPIIRSHQLGTIPLVDDRYVASLAFLKGLLRKIGAYTGHKKSLA